MPQREMSPRLLRIIDTINDKARAAQLNAATFYLVGLILLAVAFSTTDLNLVENTAEPLGTLNIPIPVTASFALAPLLFVAMHALTLIRYDMLAQDLETYREVLDNVAKADVRRREWYRHLLANVEFVQVIARRANQPDSSRRNRTPPKERLIYLTAWMTVIIVPLFTLTVVTISALRLQSPVITWTQKIAIAFDVVLLLWFLIRNLERAQPQKLGDDPVRKASWHQRLCFHILRTRPFLYLKATIDGAQPPAPADPLGAKRWSEQPFIMKLLIRPPFLWSVAKRVAGIAVLPMFVFFYCTIPSAPDGGSTGFPPNHLKNTVIQGRRLREAVNRPSPLSFQTIWAFLVDLRRQPLDLITCPYMHWGCRYLTVAGRTLASDKHPSALAFSLSDRNMRYADFRNMTAVGVSFWGSDLSEASFRSGHLNHANFDHAILEHTRFRDAHMTGASFRHADLRYADLAKAVLKKALLQKADLSNASMFKTQFQGADLKQATLVGAMMFYAKLAGADLSSSRMRLAFLAGADLSGADLSDADLAGAYMQGARLWGADLRNTDLIAADMRDTSLAMADLSRANLRGALLTNADLRYTDLGGAHFYGARTDHETRLYFADADGVDMITPLSPQRTATIKQRLSNRTLPADFASVVMSRLVRAEAPPRQHRTMAFAWKPSSIYVEHWPERGFPSLQHKYVMRRQPYSDVADIEAKGKPIHMRVDWAGTRVQPQDVSVHWRRLTKGLETCQAVQCTAAPAPRVCGRANATSGKATASADRLGDCDAAGPPSQPDTAGAAMYDRRLPSQLLCFFPASDGMQQCLVASGNQREAVFAAAHRALEEGSDDDPERNAAFAAAAIRGIQEILQHEDRCDFVSIPKDFPLTFGGKQVDIIGNSLHDEWLRLKALSRPFEKRASDPVCPRISRHGYRMDVHLILQRPDRVGRSEHGKLPAVEIHLITAPPPHAPCAACATKTASTGTGP